jgi:hypothetical protein
MNPMVHWETARARSAEARRLGAAADGHRSARLVLLTFRPRKRHR